MNEALWLAEEAAGATGAKLIGADAWIASGVSIRAALVGSAALLGLAIPLFARAFGQASGRLISRQEGVNIVD